MTAASYLFFISSSRKTQPDLNRDSGVNSDLIDQKGTSSYEHSSNCEFAEKSLIMETLIFNKNNDFANFYSLFLNLFTQQKNSSRNLSGTFAKNIYYG